MPVARNFGPLDRIQLTDKDLMREVGLLARERIVRRTRQGLDAEGQPFAPYSDGYKDRKAKELGASAVNLTVSGEMLNAITITRVEDDEVELGFSS